MGREIKRVPLDFKWPLGKVWGGFVRPPQHEPVTCDVCHGNGFNPKTRQLHDDWYDHAGFGSRWHYDYRTGIDGNPAEGPPWKVFGESRSWMYQLEQDEVDNLVAEGRLMEWTHTWTQGTGWKVDPSKPHPTADQINRAMQYGFGHDSINHNICVRFRAKKLGFYGLCPRCDGEGYMFETPSQKAAYEAWEETPIPEGPGYQMWETVSEGSPRSPVFDTPTRLAAWLVRNHASSLAEETASFAQWMAFIDAGWAPSGFVSGGKVQTGVTVALSVDRPVFNVFEVDGEPEQRVVRTHLNAGYRLSYDYETFIPKIERFEAVFP
ncbi:MAG: hypothetical protein EOP83_26505, partial [Verrucomicrobiaceae bacterium]